MLMVCIIMYTRLCVHNIYIQRGLCVVCSVVRAIPEPQFAEQQHCSPAFLCIYIKPLLYMPIPEGVRGEIINYNMKKLFTFLSAILTTGCMMAGNLLEIDFTTGQGDWRIDNKELGGLETVWQQTSRYGMRASGYANEINCTTESWLISPTVSLKVVSDANLTFSHARKYGKLSQLSVKASADGTNWTNLEVSEWPDGTSWNYVTAQADLSTFVGLDNVSVAFVYTSDESGAATWEIKTADISGNDPYINGIRYNLNIKNHTATVLGYNDKASVTIPESVTFCNETYNVTSIGDHAFYGSSNLSSVTIPNSVTSIGNKAFAETSISEIAISDNVHYVGSQAFENCPLTQIHWNVPSHDDYGYIEADSRITVTLDAANITWDHVYLYAWDNNSNALTAAWPGNELTKDNDGNYTYTFPEGYSIVNIIWNNGTEQTVDIKGISVSCKYKLTSMTGKKIEYVASPIILSPFFGENNVVENVTFGRSVIRIPAHLCDGMSSLKSLNIGENVEGIGSCAFMSCGALTEVVLPESVQMIGNSAFKNCAVLESVSLGTNVQSYGDNAFANDAKLTSIYNYRSRPAKLGIGTFEGVDYFSCILYVLAGSVDMYKSSGSDWKDFYYIEPIGAEVVTTNGTEVTPHDNTADVVWPAVSGAETYELVIKDKQGNVICTLIFNANGQLTEIAFSAPTRDNATEQAQAAGFSFTVTGLQSGTTYDLTITAKDSNGQTLQTTSQTFTTEGVTGVEDIVTNIAPTKLIRNGQIFILRGGRTYTVQGQPLQ